MTRSTQEARSDRGPAFAENGVSCACRGVLRDAARARTRGRWRVITAMRIDRWD
ncbi:hypothetical protein KCP75_02895 [Salmonella enterica subsp. enterica]|nr:hypothetical protein KCP75_02895 [Salmonella enterica subsp. enterica]